MADLLDPAVLNQIKQIIAPMADSLAKIHNIQKEMAKDSGVALDNTRDTVNELIEHAEGGLHDLARKQDDFLTLSKNGWGALFTYIKSNFSEVMQDVTGKVGGIEGAFQLMSKTSKSIFAEMPMGGWLGVLLYGQMKDSEFTAKAQEAAQQLRQVGAAMPAEQAHLLGIQMQSLEQGFLATSGEVKSVFGSLASAGVTSTEALGTTKLKIEGFNNTLAMTALGIDKTFQVASGTSVREASQLLQQTGEHMGTAVETIFELGAAAEKSGLDFARFTGAILSTSSALRLQSSDAKDLAGTFLLIKQHLQDTRNLSDQAAGNAAAKSLGAFGNILNGGSEGYNKMIAEGAFAHLQGMGYEARTKAPTDLQLLQSGDMAFSNILNTKTDAGGSQRKSEDVSRDIERANILATVEFAKSQSSTLDTQIRFMQTQIHGLDAQTATFFLENAAGIGKGQASKTVDNAISGELDRLKKDQAMHGPLQTDVFTRLMEQLMGVIANVGSSIMSVLGGAVQVLIAGFGALVPFSGISREQFRNTASGVGGNISAQMEKLGNSLSTLPGTVGQSLKQAAGMTTFEGGNWGGLIAPEGWSSGRRATSNDEYLKNREMWNMLKPGPVDMEAYKSFNQTGGFVGSRTAQSTEDFPAAWQQPQMSMKDGQRPTGVVFHAEFTYDGQIEPGGVPN